MAKASDVIKIALAEVGYKEKASNSQLDNPTANAGSNNYTKYARDLRDAGYYNGNKNGFAWCDVFVDWCFYKAFGKTEGQRIECQTGDLGAGCKYSKQYYQNKGRCDRNPKVGDQIFFTSGGSISHTGIVTAVSGEKVEEIEIRLSRKQLPEIFGKGYEYPVIGHVMALDNKCKGTMRTMFEIAGY